MNKFIFTAVAAVCLPGCASIVSGQNQSISVTTSPVDGAECKLNNEKGEWYVSQTPGSVTVHRAYGPLTISCEKNAYSGLLTSESKTKGMAFGNVVFGGLIGGGVDMATGAAYDYPPTINVPMKKKIMAER